MLQVCYTVLWAYGGYRQVLFKQHKQEISQNFKELKLRAYVIMTMGGQIAYATTNFNFKYFH